MKPLKGTFQIRRDRLGPGRMDLGSQWGKESVLSSLPCVWIGFYECTTSANLRRDTALKCSSQDLTFPYSSYYCFLLSCFENMN